MRLMGEKGQTVMEYLLVIILLSMVIFFAVNISSMRRGVEDSTTEMAEEFSSFKMPPPGGT